MIFVFLSLLRWWNILFRLWPIQSSSQSHYVSSCLGVLALVSLRKSVVFYGLLRKFLILFPLEKWYPTQRVLLMVKQRTRSISSEQLLKVKRLQMSLPSQETIDLSPERKVIFFMVGVRDASINVRAVPSDSSCFSIQTRTLIIACRALDGNIRQHYDP